MTSINALGQTLDSIPNKSFELGSENNIILDEVFVFEDLRFNSPKKLLEYLILKRRVLKTYPYAYLASKRLQVLNNRLTAIKKKSKKKKYIRRIHRYIEDELTPHLKKLSYNDARILIKLIHRQTGYTCYDLVKDYRSGFKALVYQTTAKLFSLSLKTEYNPEKVFQDFLIEDILIRNFNNGTLKKQSSYNNIDYFEISKLWIKDDTHFYVN